MRVARLMDSAKQLTRGRGDAQTRRQRRTASRRLAAGQRQRKRRSHVETVCARTVLAFVVCLVALGLHASARAQAPSSGALPEASQCESTKFLIGLRQQGLFTLQEEYMKAYPPTGAAEKAWYERESILAKALEAGSIESRVPLLGQSDDAAGKAIEAEPDSPRSILWRADRAQTWYYLASRPLFEQVLFYGPSPGVRRGLKESADRADQAYDQAITAVTSYLDQLADAQNETLATQIRQLNLSVFGLSRQLAVRALLGDAAPRLCPRSWQR